MAKKKKQRSEEKKEFAYTNELIGLTLILLSITGLGNFGIVGEIVKKFAVFLFGSWFFLFLGFTLILGVYLIAKRSYPNYFTSKLIGLYCILIAFILFLHVNFITNQDLPNGEIIRQTFTNVTEVMQCKAADTMDNCKSVISNTGGGMIGALLSYAFVSLFAVEGTYVVMAIILTFGIIMMFDITLSDMFGWVGRLFKKREVEESDEEEETTEEEEQVIGGKTSDGKLVIKSFDDLEPKVEAPAVNLNFEEPQEETNETYIKPPLTLLAQKKNKDNKNNNKELVANNTKILERVFQDFGMVAKVIEVHVGPAVTQYEMELQRGTKVNKVLSISREIALALAAKEVRIEAPIPGKNTVGVEIPNPSIMAVSMREIMEDLDRNPKYKDSKLAAPLGRDIMGRVKCVEINKTPHMLVAGATGSGKSVCINNIILSIIMRSTPDEVKMVLVDPKKVEFNVYEGIPHLLTPVVTDPKKASAALQKIVVEMDDRYETFKDSGTKNIQTYNEYVEKKLKKDPDCGLKPMPFILVIIDELADLMLVAAKEVEESIMRITQLARAAGIHLIVATQRPSTDIITGVVKSNIPTRCSFAVSSSIDSRTILDMTGAEKLLGRGDMLYKPMDDNTPTRIQGSFVGDDEIKAVVDFVKIRSHGPKYSSKFENLTSSSDASAGGVPGMGGSDQQKDVLYDEVLNYAIRMGQISASLIQRKYSIGYNRAARIMDMFEEKGLVGPAKGSKPRDVLVKLEGSEEDQNE